MKLAEVLDKHLGQHHLQPTLLRGGHDPNHSMGMCRVPRLHQHGDTRQSRHGSLQQLEELGAEVGGADRQARHVPAGPRQARGKAVAYRVKREGDDDGNGRGGVLQRAVGGRRRGHDDIDFQAHQLRGKGGQALGFPVREACLDDEVRALDIAELAHARQERRVAAGIQRRLARAKVEKPDTRNLRLSLSERASPHRQRARAERDEESPPRGHERPPTRERSCHRPTDALVAATTSREWGRCARGSGGPAAWHSPRPTAACPRVARGARPTGACS